MAVLSPCWPSASEAEALQAGRSGAAEFSSASLHIPQMVSHAKTGADAAITYWVLLHAVQKQQSTPSKHVKDLHWSGTKAAGPLHLRLLWQQCYRCPCLTSSACWASQTQQHRFQRTHWPVLPSPNPEFHLYSAATWASSSGTCSEASWGLLRSLSAPCSLSGVACMGQHLGLKHGSELHSPALRMLHAGLDPGERRPGLRCSLAQGAVWRACHQRGGECRKLELRLYKVHASSCMPGYSPACGEAQWAAAAHQSKLHALQLSCLKWGWCPKHLNPDPKSPGISPRANAHAFASRAAALQCSEGALEWPSHRENESCDHGACLGRSNTEWPHLPRHANEGCNRSPRDTAADASSTVL